MGLFQKKPQVSSSAPAYTIGAQRIVLIVGLGNPGKDYAATRHNVGFDVVDGFARRNDFPAWLVKKELNCLLSSHVMGDVRVILCKPTTFMNDSGLAARAVQHFYKISNQSTLAVYDELAIKFGQIRSRLGGSDAGHNGVKSLIEHLGDEFGRLRVGIDSSASARTDATDFVMAKFSKIEQAKLPNIIKEVGVMLTEYIYSGELPHDTRKVG